MSFEIKGKVELIRDTQQISEKFKKREFVLLYEENPQYPEVIQFSAIQDKCEALNEYRVGDEVTVHFNLKGRKWQPADGSDAKFFNELQVWKLEKHGN